MSFYDQFKPSMIGCEECRTWFYCRDVELKICRLGKLFCPVCNKRTQGQSDGQAAHGV